MAVTDCQDGIPKVSEKDNPTITALIHSIKRRINLIGCANTSSFQVKLPKTTLSKKDHTGVLDGKNKAINPA